MNLPPLTKSPNETFTNWTNRRKMCAGLEHEPYVDPYPIDMGTYLQYPHFIIDKESYARFEQRLIDLRIKRVLTWHQIICNLADSRTWKEKYQLYIQSPEWKQIRSRKITACGSVCEICNKFCSSLQVHHLHYRTVGEERNEDLMVVCKNCHPQVDEERRKRMANQADNNAYETFCMKKYGAVLDSPSAYEDFCQWQISKESGYECDYYPDCNRSGF